MEKALAAALVHEPFEARDHPPDLRLLLGLQVAPPRPVLRVGQVERRVQVAPFLPQGRGLRLRLFSLGFSPLLAIEGLDLRIVFTGQRRPAVFSPPESTPFTPRCLAAALPWPNPLAVTQTARVADLLIISMEGGGRCFVVVGFI